MENQNIQRNKKGRFIKGITSTFKGKKHNKKTLKKMSISQKKSSFWRGKKLSIEHKRKLSVAKKGEKHFNWKGGISRDKHSLTKPEYKEWRSKVFQRDNWKCQIKDENCKGKIEVHHILAWRDFPELRYEVNNGITLCHAHHPRKRKDEAELSPYFQKLVANSKESK